MNRAGKLVKNMTGELAYQSFCPSPLPPVPALAIDDVLLDALLSASRSLKQLDVSSQLIPSAELFVSMYVRKEAILSSQLEGTQCTLDDILDPELDANVNLDAAEVTNYVKAAQFALERLHTLPICNRLLREVHAILMDGVRGKEKDPGEFRRSQNWIGPAGCTLKEARYIPPNPDDMKTAISDLEKYINESTQYDPLIRAALIHYQFETIHPFLDGNGSIGRLLILLYLMEQGLLQKPVIYVSYFLKKNQAEYYYRISELRRSGNYEQWVKFFLEAVDAAAVDAADSITRLSALHDANIALLPPPRRKKDNVRALFDYLEKHPIIDIGHTAAALGVSYNTVSAAVNALAERGILQATTNAARNRVFAYEAYLEILRKDT